jgi:uncharacterized protein
VSGASGLIGSALVPCLARHGYQVSRLVRRRAEPGEIAWDPERGVIDRASLVGVDVVVHLSGENLASRWTAARKARIRSSRVVTTRLLSDAIASLHRPPALLVSASAVGIYGNRGDETLTEASNIGDPRADFLVSVVREWEGAADSARASGVRVVHPRFGVVLSPAGGALKTMLLPFRLGLGGRLGTGRQWLSWISLDDAVDAIVRIIASPQLHGPVNVTAPAPVTNQAFTRALGSALSRPARLAVPAPALRLALGEMADTVLGSIRAVPARLLETGYHFAHPKLDAALSHVLERLPRANFPA